MNRTEVKLFLTIWLVYALHFTPAGGVTPNRYVDLVHSIVNEGRFEIDTYHENTIDKAYYNGHYYAGALPGPAFLAVPAYIVFKGLYALLPQSVRDVVGGIQSYKKEKLADSSFYGRVDNAEFFLSQAFLVVFTVAVASALASVLFFRILRLMNTDNPIAYSLTISFAFGTILFWNSTVFFEQAFTVFFAVAAFFVLLRMSQIGFSNLGLVLGGFLAGSVLLIELSGIFLGILLFVYVLLNIRRPIAMFYWVGYAIPVLVLALYDYHLFGNPFSTPYQHLAGREYEAVIKEGFVGLSYPHIDRIVGLLISPERGIFVFAPITILGLSGLLIPSRKRSDYRNETIFFTLVVSAAFLFVSSFRGWNAGGAFGPRYLMFGLAFMVLPAAFVLNKSNLNAGLVITSVSVLINWAGAQYGFAQNYYEHLASLLVKGSTLPIFEAVITHAATSNPLFELIKAHRAWLSGLAIVSVFVFIGALWSWFGLKSSKREKTPYAT